MKVTVIIPNYNGMKFLKDCLDSLREQTYEDFRTLVVDNCSADESVKFIRENYPEVQVIRLRENFGFSRAVNVGIRKAETPYVLLLNNDIKAEPDFVGELVKTMERSAKVFAVASRMVKMYSPDMMDSAGDNYTCLGWAYNRGGELPVDCYEEPAEVFSACAGAALYRRDVFREIGLFDEAHFAYLEDLDVSYRARIRGYQVLYCPTAVVYHVGSGTSGSKYNAFKVKLSARNSVYVIYKNMPLLQRIINFPAIAAGDLVKYLFFAAKGLGGEWREGHAEGMENRKNLKKVPVKMKNMRNYLRIQGMLMDSTWEYGKEQYRKRTGK